jgi:hypothetical protein
VVAALDSSKSFDHRPLPAAAKQPPRFADRSRFRGYRGGVIAMHRALARFVLEPLDLVTAALLVLVFTFVWIASLPWLCRFWQSVLQIGMRMLAIHTQLGLTEHEITPYIRFAVPFPRMEAFLPDAQTWWSSAVVVIVLFAASFLFSKKFMPVMYLLRAVLFIHVTALAFFLFLPARFSHSPDSYMEGLTGYAIALIGFVPALFGLTYYIFDFGIARKALLTIITMIHLSLFVPLQILLQAIVLQKSVLFMPVLFIVFGLPVNVLIILAFYSWGMSWSFKNQRERER